MRPSYGPCCRRIYDGAGHRCQNHIPMGLHTSGQGRPASRCVLGPPEEGGLRQPASAKKFPYRVIQSAKVHIIASEAYYKKLLQHRKVRKKSCPNKSKKTPPSPVKNVSRFRQIAKIPKTMLPQRVVSNGPKCSPPQIGTTDNDSANSRLGNIFGNIGLHYRRGKSMLTTLRAFT